MGLETSGDRKIHFINKVFPTNIYLSNTSLRRSPNHPIFFCICFQSGYISSSVCARKFHQLFTNQRSTKMEQSRFVTNVVEQKEYMEAW
jgi:hypothetical protein